MGSAADHRRITGGLYGAALLINRLTGTLSPGIWNLLLNAPLLYLGWRYFSRRFFLYAIYGTILLTVLLESLDLNYPIQQQLYAAIATGIICGAGSGLILRSRGAGGGLDIVALFLLRKWNIGVGKFYMMYNSLLFSFLAANYNPDVFIASLILTFTLSTMMDRWTR